MDFASNRVEVEGADDDSAAVIMSRIEAKFLLAMMNTAISVHGAPPPSMGALMLSVVTKLDEAFEFGIVEAALND